MDTGQQVLEAHFGLLMDDIREKHFHDFDSSFTTPKIYLVQRLQALIDNVKKGTYDN